MNRFILAAAAATAILAASPALATCYGDKCNPEPPKGGDALSQALHAALNNQQAQGQVQGQQQGQIATGGNAGAGAIANASGGKGGKGGKGGAGGAGGAGGSSDATGGSSTSGSQSGSSSGGNTVSGGNTNVDASQHTTNRFPAASAAPALLPGYGQPNCVGDTNPSGQLALSAQATYLGLTGASMKAHNFCAMLAVAGPAAARAYLAQVDPNARKAMLNNGAAIRKIDADRRAKR